MLDSQCPSIYSFYFYLKAKYENLYLTFHFDVSCVPGGGGGTLTHHTPVPTVVVIQICLLYCQCRLHLSQNIRGFFVIYFALGIAEEFYILSSGTWWVNVTWWGGAHFLRISTTCSGKICISIPCFGIIRLQKFLKTIGKTIVYCSWKQ